MTTKKQDLDAHTINQVARLRRAGMNKKKESLGAVAVDTGRLLIIDPCYAAQFTDTKEYVEGPFQDGILFDSGYGDGIYEVTAERDENGRIVRVTIDMGLGS